MNKSSTSSQNTFLRYVTYPLLAGLMLGYAYLELVVNTGTLGAYQGYYIFTVIISMLLLESLHPLQTRWRMTRETFFRRDLWFLLIGSITIGLTNYAATMAIVHFGLQRGTSHLGLPFLPAVLLVLLIGDLIWYWLHRISHEAKGPLGRWLWRTHIAHHLPQQVYVLMHAVSHPINTIMVRIILTVPFFFLGFSTEVLFFASLVIGLQGLVSHFNMDIRVGWLNYVLMGTELHRYHHSANLNEAKNFGAVTTVWDQLFGTFYYRPERVPEYLGLSDPDDYPTDRQIGRVMALPFKS